MNVIALFGRDDHANPDPAGRPSTERERQPTGNKHARRKRSQPVHKRTVDGTAPLDALIDSDLQICRSVAPTICRAELAGRERGPGIRCGSRVGR